MTRRTGWDCPDCAGVLDRTPEGGGRLVHSDGCPVGAALDAMSARDRAYFDAHPGVTEYWRDLMPGDLGLGSLGCVGSSTGEPLRVRVRRLGDGVRVRRLPSHMVVFLGSEDGNRLALRLGAAPKGAA